MIMEGDIFFCIEKFVICLQCSIYPPTQPSQTNKITIQMSQKLSYYIQIICVTCLNILKMDIRTSAIKLFGKNIDLSA